MSGSGQQGASLYPPRALRRLGQPLAVTTTYEHRGGDDDAAEPDSGQAASSRRGYEDGFAEGLARAARETRRSKADVARQVARALEALARAVADAHEVEGRIWAEVQESVPRLVFELLEVLLAREAKATSDPLRDTIVRALALDGGIRPATVRLNPADVATLGDPDQVGDLGGGRELRLIADETIEPGGALVDIGKATIDAQLGTALDRVRRALLGPDERGASDDGTP